MVDPCGNYNNTSGVLISPGFPYKYQDEIECIYKLSVEDNNIIKIFFSEFDLEFDNDLDCRNDFLEMNDGESEYSLFIGRFCGDENDVQTSLRSQKLQLGHIKEIPRVLYSTQNKMWIRYVQA